MKKIILLTILTVASLFAKPCMTDIYFGNGVWNTRIQAKKSKDALRRFMLSNYNARMDRAKEGFTYDFKYAYNPSSGSIDDLIETFWQLKESGQISYGYFMAVYTALTLEDSGELYNKLTEIIQEYREDANAMFALYKNESFKQKHNVLLVAHSQGNLFGNKMYTLMNGAQKKKFRMVSVATPADHISGGGSYVTAYLDYVIAGIPNHLSANVDGVGHTFIGTYLGSSFEARTQIALYVKIAYDNLLQTTSCNSYKYYVWVTYMCPTRRDQELVVDIYGRPADAPYPYKKELVTTDSRVRMPQNINGNCSVSGDDMLSLFNKYDQNGCTAYSMEDTTGNSRSVDTVKANVYKNGYLCTQYKMKPEVVSTLKSMESF